jgi:acyl-homoserine lactone acylase PvdQ
VRPATVDPGLPVRGNGDFEWQGFLPFASHPNAISPASGAIVNWNNKPAPGFTAADDNWSYGSVHRVELLQRGIAARKTHTLASVVGAMNQAATQDIRVLEVWPSIAEVVRGNGSARTQQLIQLLDQWRERGGSRLDLDGDNLVDDPGAAIMDSAWPKLADAVLSPVLGPLLQRLPLIRDDRPDGSGNAYGSGWYGYVDKDLRELLGKSVVSPFRTHFCGAGDLSACRTALLAALEATGDQLTAALGADPTRWRADARPERTQFAGGLLPRTMRFANRPTFQQVFTFGAHRGR